MTTVAFVGLGTMGAPMARNLLAANFHVVGYNRSPDRVREFVEAGGHAAEDLAAAVHEADVVCTMLPDSPDVHAVMTEPNGVFASASRGTLVIDFSTIRPDVSRQLSAEAASGGLRMIDAPVSGGDVGAIEGTLSIMVGGKSEDFDAAQPVLRSVGRTVTHVGPVGAGQTVKAANQLVVAGNIAMLAEAIVFLEAHGTDVGSGLRALSGGLAGSRVLDLRGESMTTRSFEPGFRAELHRKDLGIVLSAAREVGAVLPVSGLVAQLMEAVVTQGNGHLDNSALMTVVDQLRTRP